MQAWKYIWNAHDHLAVNGKPLAKKQQDLEQAYQDRNSGGPSTGYNEYLIARGRAESRTERDRMAKKTGTRGPDKKAKESKRGAVGGWSKLKHANGAATDVPDLLAGLHSKDATERATALRESWSALWSDEDWYSAQPPFVEELFRLAADPTVEDRHSSFRETYLRCSSSASEASSPSRSSGPTLQARDRDVGMGFGWGHSFAWERKAATKS